MQLFGLRDVVKLSDEHEHVVKYWLKIWRIEADAVVGGRSLFRKPTVDSILKKFRERKAVKNKDQISLSQFTGGSTK